MYQTPSNGETQRHVRSSFCVLLSVVFVRCCSCQWMNSSWPFLLWYTKTSQLMSDDYDETVILASAMMIFSSCALLCDNCLMRKRRHSLSFSLSLSLSLSLCVCCLACCIRLSVRQSSRGRWKRGTGKRGTLKVWKALQFSKAKATERDLETYKNW